MQTSPLSELWIMGGNNWHRLSPWYFRILFLFVQGSFVIDLVAISLLGMRCLVWTSRKPRNRQAALGGIGQQYHRCFIRISPMALQCARAKTGRWWQ